jgi:hypothetical protein
LPYDPKTDQYETLLLNAQVVDFLLLVIQMSWKQHGGGKGRDMSRVARGGKDQFNWDTIKMDKDRVSSPPSSYMTT